MKKILETSERVIDEWIEQIKEILDKCEIKPAVLQTEVHPYSL